MRDNPLFGIDWKHIDDDGEDYVYRRTFGNLYELLAYVRDRYGARFTRLVETNYIKGECGPNGGTTK